MQEPEPESAAVADLGGAQFEVLDVDLQSNILSFVNEADLWLILRHTGRLFLPAIRQTITSKKSIHFSFLRQLFPNKPGNTAESHQQGAETPQQGAVRTLTSLLLRREGPHNLRHFECANVKGLSGTGWLPRLPSTLETLDLEGCREFLPAYLEAFLTRSTNLRELTLTKCEGVDGHIVKVIANTCPQLRALFLGGCSQRIEDEAIQMLLTNLKQLQHLGLQALNRISDKSGQFMAKLPSTMQSLDISGCQQLRLVGAEAFEGIQVYLSHASRPTPEYWATVPTCRHSNMMHLVLNDVGAPRMGLSRGIVAYFAMGRQLREVHLSGCEHIDDWEIEALAVTCASSLTCLQMRACRIGDTAIKALAKYCQVLAEVDVSACFRVGDEGIIALSEARRCITSLAESDDISIETKRGRMSSRLRVLRVSSLPGLTDQGVAAMAKMDGLHVLEVENCIDVSPVQLVNTVLHLPRLIEINAKGIQEYRNTFTSLLQDAYKTSPGSVPIGLRMVNEREFSWKNKDNTNIDSADSCCASLLSCCTVRTQAQRLDARTIPLAIMYHCIDCFLLPSVDRGICACCVSKCHRNHRTYMGSWTRFYCDCPFGVAAEMECQAIFPAMTTT